MRPVALLLAFGVMASAPAQLAVPVPSSFGQAVTTAQLLAKPSEAPAVTWRVTRDDNRGIEEQTEFASPLRTSYPTNNRVPLTLMMPSKVDAPTTAPRAVVFILHYLGARDLRAEKQLGHELNLRGMAAAIIELPYHLSRAPEGTRSGELAVQPDPTVLTSTMVQSILDVRRALEIVTRRPDIDPEQVGVAGISLGSLVAELAFGVEPRFKQAGFLLGGTNLAHILWRSSRVIVSRASLRSDGYTEDLLRQSISAIEPSTYLLRRRALFPDERHDALAIGGRFDTVVPPYSFHQLVDALPDPTVVTLNTGHYGGIFVEKRLLSEVANYFSSWNTKTPYEAPKDIQEVTFRLTAQAVAPTGFDIGVGVDVFRTHANYEAFGTVVLTPKGLELFVAQSIGGGLAAGGLVGTHGFGFGLFWSSIL